MRSLAGLIRNSGILRPGHEKYQKQALALYRDYAPDGPVSTAFRAEHSYDTDIEFIGVWDTVGALGIPGMDGSFSLLKGMDWQFHDVTLSRRLKRACHAVAIREHRAEFVPTLWEQAQPPPPGQILEQVWFSGAHSGVGGGYEQCGLSDVALQWMIEKAGRSVNFPDGLEFNPAVTATFRPDPLEPGHNSFGTFYRVLDWVGRKKGGVLRVYQPDMPGATGNLVYQALHESVRTRRLKARPPKQWPATFLSAL